MRSEIRHSGAVNDDPRFSLSLSEIDYPTITVGDGGEPWRTFASLRTQLTEGELRALIRQAQCALEDCRLRGLFGKGELSAEAYSEALRALDKSEPPQEGVPMGGEERWLRHAPTGSASAGGAGR